LETELCFYMPFIHSKRGKNEKKIKKKGWKKLKKLQFENKREKNWVHKSVCHGCVYLIFMTSTYFRDWLVGPSYSAIRLEDSIHS